MLLPGNFHIWTGRVYYIRLSLRPAWLRSRGHGRSSLERWLPDDHQK